MKKPHLEKIKAALNNPLAKEDRVVLEEILAAYENWHKQTLVLKEKGDLKIEKMVNLLNQYKDYVEIDLMMKKGSRFLTRQKGQLKLNNSILEEFFIWLIDESIIPELQGIDFTAGPEKAFMSLAFQPRDLHSLSQKPEITLKTKDQDFTFGKQIFFKFSPDKSFNERITYSGELTLAVIAAECKINLDKTMFQEGAGTATRLKQGIPYAKYYILCEFLDMQPEDCRLTDIDNVFLLRHAKRLPYELRNDIKAVITQRKGHPIDHEVVIKFINEVRSFLKTKWYNPEIALKKGSFV